MHIELDAVRSLIISGTADPQEPGDLQSEQYETAVQACCALASVFLSSGYDVAIDDVLELDAFNRSWMPALGEMEAKVVILVPKLDETLHRAAMRTKRVKPELIWAQHTACSIWPQSAQVDSTGLTLDETLQLLRERGLLP